MSGIVKPCPWCDSKDLSWSIPPCSRVLTPYCVECEAKGPSTIVKDRGDQALCDVEAIRAWNGAR